MFLGTPRGYKGVEDLADAVGRLGRPDVVLALVGTEPASATGRALGARHPGIRLVGRIPIAQVPGFLSAADLVVVPAAREQRHARPGAGEALRRHGPGPADRLHAGVHDPGDPRGLRGAGPAGRRGRARLGHRAPARPARRGARARGGGPAPGGGPLQLRGRPARALSPGRASARGRPLMRLGLICRPFSFHGGVETATAGLLTALRHAGHDVELISTRRQASVPGPRGPPRADAAPSLRAPTDLVRGRGARRGGAPRIRPRAEPRARARPGCLPRGRGLPRRLPRGDATEGHRARPVPSPGPGPRAAHLPAPHRAARGGDLAAGQGGDRAAVRHRSGAGDPDLQRGGSRALPSRQPGPPPPPDATGAPHSRGGVDRALRGLGLRAQGPGPACSRPSRAWPTRTAGWS